MTTTYLGTTPGAFSVDQNGGAGYSIPIQVPPGTSALQPQLSLVYNSAGANDVAGMGWQLQGLSSIGRVGATLAQDGFHGDVEYGVNDRFALDGTRLMVANGGTYGQPGAVYHTEIETWQQVTPVYQSTPAPNGPDSWTVNTKSGLTLDFGQAVPAGTNTTAIREWRLSRITDLHGNTMTVSYDLDAANSMAYPTNIAYTGNGSMQPARAVAFTYASRPDVLTRYEGGGAIAVARLLTRIETLLEGDVVRAYSLQYRTGTSTGRSQLLSVTEADGSGNPLPPTVTQWQDGNAGIFAPGQAPQTYSNTAGGSFLSADMDGNGLVDLVNARPTLDGFLQVDLYLSDGQNGFGSEPVSITTKIPFGSESALLPMDVDGDGAIELVCVTGASNGACGEGTYVSIGVVDAVAGEGGVTLQAVPNVGPCIPWNSQGVMLPMDVNGDGMIDLVYAGEVDENLALTVLLSTGNIVAGGLFAALPDQPPPTVRFFAPGPFLPSAQFLTGDFNGDGLDDLLYVFENDDAMSIVPFLASPQNFNLVPGDPIDGTGIPTTKARLMALDINGDGLTDLVHAGLVDQQLSVQTFACQGVSHSSGLTFGAATASQPVTLQSQGSGIPTLLPCDVNGDGLTDFVVAFSDDMQVVVNVLVGDGATFAAQSSVTTPPASWVAGGPVLPMDFNGDGRTDLVCVGGPTASSLQVGTMSAAGPFPDLVTRITNGLGGQFAVAYAPLTNSSIYTAGAAPGNSAAPVKGLLNNGVSGATFPLVSGTAAPSAAPGAAPTTRKVDFPKYVVASYTKSDGRGTSYGYSYFYESALMDLTGRGWCGFASIAVTDADFQNVTTTAYAQTFPLTFTATNVTTQSTGGALMKNVANTYTAQTNGYGIPMVLLTATQTDYFTFATGPDPTPDCTEARAITYDAFGNATVTFDGGTYWGAPLYTTVSWSNDADAWLIGFRLAQIVSADPQGNTVLRKSEWTYDDQMSVVVFGQWNDQNQQMQQTKYQYDAYGNQTAVQDPSGATSSTAYDGTYNTFVTQQTSPPNTSGVSLTWQYQNDAAFGVITSKTDPNGVTFTQTYDGLGRLTARSGPDPGGNPVTLSSETWATDKDGTYRLTNTLSNWSGTQSWSREYFDGLFRVWRKAVLGPDGETQVNVDKTFRGGDQEATITLPYYAGAAPQTSTMSYDAFQRLIQTQVPQGSALVATDFQYPAYNRQVRIENAGQSDTRTTTTQLAVFQSAVRILTQTDNAGDTTTYAYDALGNVTSMTDAIGVVTSAAYDTLGRGVSSAVQSGNQLQMQVTTSYDDAARTMTLAEASETTIVYSFDALLRPVTRSVQQQGGTPAVTTFIFDSSASSYTMDRVSSVTMPDGSTYAYSYDPLGRQSGLTLATGGGTFDFVRAYNPGGQIDQIQFPDGAVQNNTYNAASQLVSIALTPSGGAQQQLLELGEFTPFSTVGQLTYGNSVAARFQYDATGMLNERSLTGPSGTIDSVSFTYDPFHAITALQDNVSSGDSQSFGYDAVGRLNAASGSYAPQQYQFDGGGNITQKNTVSYQSNGYEVTQGSDGFSATYDSNGNIVTAVRNGVTSNYVYDGDNQLISCGGVTLSYDYAGRRLTKSVAGGATTIYAAPYYESVSYADGSSQHTIHVMNGMDVVASVTTVEAGSPPPAPGTPAPGTFYLHQDHLHSTIFQTGIDGSVTQTLVYLPDGQFTVGADQADTVRQKYAGKEWDADLGLYYFGARYYDPVLSRFLTADDRLGGPPGGQAILNRYAYAGNDPVNHIDPTGHHWWDWVLATVTCVAGLALAGAAYMTGNVVLGSVLAGAAIGGLQYEVTAAIKGQNFSWGQFGIQVGIGAATGLIAGGIASAGAAILGRLGVAAADATVETLSNLRTAVKVVTAIVSGISSGVSQQFLENAANHVSLATGLGTAAVVGLGTGVLGAAASEVLTPRLATAVDEFGFARDPESMSLLGDTSRWQIQMTTENKIILSAPPILINGIGGVVKRYLPVFP